MDPFIRRIIFGISGFLLLTVLFFSCERIDAGLPETMLGDKNNTMIGIK